MEPVLEGEGQKDGTFFAHLRLAWIGVAAAKCLGGMVFLALGPSAWAQLSDNLIPLWVYPAHILVFGLAAAILLQAPGGDRRVPDLAAVFLCVASSFSDRLVVGLGSVDQAPLAAVGHWLGAIQPEAFLPWFLWRFARRFPRLTLFGQPRRIQRLFERASLIAGSGLLLVNLAVKTPLADFDRLALLQPLERVGAAPAYWLVVLSLAGASLPFVLWKARRTRITERRKVRLFTAGLVLGLAPVTIEVILETILPPFFRFIRQPTPFLVAGIAIYASLLSIPATTSYAVLVHQALDVRLVVRRALRYALAKGGLLLMAGAPVALLGLYLFAHRGQSLAELLAGWRSAIALALAFVGWLGLKSRKPLLKSLDRRFFREQFDAREILTGLIDRSRDVGDVAGLAEVVEDEVSRALHPASVALLLRRPESGDMLAPRGQIRGLAADSVLLRRLAASAGPLAIELDRSETLATELTIEDRAWVADGGYCVLVPLAASQKHALGGLLALGEKLSELPYTSEDLELLGSIGASVALVLERLLLRASQASAVARVAEDAIAPAGAEVAAECPVCGLVLPAGAEHCGRCGGETVPARLPEVVAGKFRLERRLGAGGMGVVYVGVDLLLERRVAIKTLPQVSPERAIRLRREARAMARVSHPNLALILGAETWRGTPVLVVELLEGGTLSDRLASGPLSLDQVVKLGLALADVLEHLHGAGILHRDLKPSNIGLAADGQPKLLDFGLARMIGLQVAAPPSPAVTSLSSDADLTLVASAAATQAEIVDGVDTAVETISSARATLVTRRGVLVGTPLYLSPEAFAGESPDPSFDLWSLALVLWEAAAGMHPALVEGKSGALERLRRAQLPELSTVVPASGSGLSGLLSKALARDRRRRPQTAHGFRRRLRRLRAAFDDSAAA